MLVQRLTNRKEWKHSLLKFFPEHISRILEMLPENLDDNLEEIRMRIGRPLMLVSAGRDYVLAFTGGISSSGKNVYIITSEDIEKTLQFMSQYSLYAIEEELRNGYITLPGGYRVGVVGKVVMAGSAVKTIKYISGLNIRIGREMIGVADKIMKFIIQSDGFPLHTLIVSPPQCGKTTLIRDIARQLSNGGNNTRGYKVVIVDERSEIAGSYVGIAQNDVGMRTDVLDACPKALGIMMAIRSMSPEIIVTDEVGRQEDIYAIEEALNCGVVVIATAHGRDIHEIEQRPVLKQLVDRKFFQRYIILGKSLGTGTVEAIYDGFEMRNILPCPIR